MAEEKATKHSWNFKDLTGQRFGRLIAERYLGSKCWQCLCDCGQTTIVRSSPLLSKNIHRQTRSCGCYAREASSARNATHRMSHTKEWKAWDGAKQRCTNPLNASYSDYGGRGIRMCAEWLNNFQQFFADMGNCPVGHSIERKDPNGHYEVLNCRWATNKEQGRNKRNTAYITHDGITLPLTEWAERTGIGQATIRLRQKQGRPLFAPRYESRKLDNSSNDD